MFPLGTCGPLASSATCALLQDVDSMLKVAVGGCRLSFLCCTLWGELAHRLVWIFRKSRLGQNPKTQFTLDSPCCVRAAYAPISREAPTFGLLFNISEQSFGDGVPSKGHVLAIVACHLRVRKAKKPTSLNRNPSLRRIRHGIPGLLHCYSHA